MIFSFFLTDVKVQICFNSFFLSVAVYKGLFMSVE